MRNNEQRSPSEKARRATFGIIARLGGCAYLAYIIIRMIKMSVEGTSDIPKGVVIATTAVMGLAALVLIVFTVRDFLTGVKNQDYSMHKYYQDELKEKGLIQNEFGEYVPAEPSDAAQAETETADMVEESDETGETGEDNSQENDDE